MKKSLLSVLSILFYLFCNSQNVGVGTATPAEKLDVNGNINVAGQIKLAGNAGLKNQVLTKDASNNPVWGDLSEFKNIQVFDCAGTAFSLGSSNCTDSWNVPAGVTTILVECWGGGGGGCSESGGGGGGYISARLTVTPLAVATLTTGAGGNFGNPSVAYGIAGGTTAFSIGPVTLQATGGVGGTLGDPLTSISNGQASGGGFSVSGITNQYIGFYGSPGGLSKVSFMVAGSSDYAKMVNFGDGGDAALLPGSGAKGGYKLVSATVSQTIYATQYGLQNGGGGGADATGGFYGRGGRIIIHW